MRTPRVLVVDEDLAACEALLAALDGGDWLLETCTDPDEVRARVDATDFDVVLTDQDVASLEAFSDLLADADSPAVIFLKSFGSIQDAVESIRAGAADYLPKPADPERLRMAVERALERRELRSENARLRADLAGKYDLGRVHSRDPRMLAVFETVRAVADARATLLLQGESGTGKTLLARTIHQASERARAPFVELNCGALPSALLESELFGHVRGAFTGAVRDKPGKFELADGGTIFLDEIGCAPLDLQVKLLRVLQDRIFERVGGDTTLEVDVRVIAATNASLREEVAQGRFREDLFYRLNVVTLDIPPLRERTEDVRLLAEEFLARFATEHGRAARRFEPRAWAAILGHRWPGNVRELENAVERAVLLSTGSEVPLEALPPELVESVRNSRPLAGLDPSRGSAARVDAERVAANEIVPLKDALAAPEERLLRQALAHNLGNRKRTAAMLGINRTTLFNKMRKYGLLDVPFTGDGGGSDGQGSSGEVGSDS